MEAYFLSEFLRKDCLCISALETFPSKKQNKTANQKQENQFQGPAKTSS